MKVKEIIERLTALDPIGNMEVNINGCDIITIDSIPAYYDGSLQRINRSHTEDGYMEVDSCEYIGCGDKIVMQGVTIGDILEDHWSLPVSVSGYMNGLVHKEEIAKFRYQGYKVALEVDKYPCESCKFRPIGIGAKFTFREISKSCNECYPFNRFAPYERDKEHFGEHENNIGDLDNATETQ